MTPYHQAVIREVIQALQISNSLGAISILNESLENDPVIVDYYYELGINYANLSMLDEALTILNAIEPYKKNDVKVFYNIGLLHSLQGNHELALLAYYRALNVKKNDLDTLINLSSTHNELGNFNDALTLLKQATQISPKSQIAWLNLGVVLNNLNLHLESVDAYNKVICFDPSNYEAYVKRGESFGRLKRFTEVLDSCDKALELKPDYAEAWSNKGNALHELKRFDEAIACHNKVISLKPDYAEGWYNKGNALHELKRFDEAIDCHNKVISLKPDYAEGWSNKGNAAHELKCFDEAIAYYDRALSIKPNYAECWSNKGNSLHELRRYDEAITHYDKALSLKPDYAEGWFNKGKSLYELRRYDEAITHYDKALRLKPDYVQGWSNKAMILNELRRYDEAITHYNETLNLNPYFNWVSGELIYIKMKICSWSGLADSLEILSKKIMASEKVSSPFATLALKDDALLHKKSAEVFVQSKYPFNAVLGSFLKHLGSQKIRVGYFSADFKNHAVSNLTAELYELHDKNKFEIIAFSFGVDDKSPMRLRLGQAFNQFIDVSNMSDLDIAKLSRNLKIDIAVDLGGYTGDSRTKIFSYRAAPIQISYIGYLGTMGAEYYDYLLADKTILPENLQQFYSEKIIYLPSYQVNDRKRIIAEKQFTRPELRLPEAGFVFCCFNNNYKILPSTFDGWMRILNAVENSVLFLYVDNEWAQANLLNEARLRGIDCARLVFGGRIPAEEYLARYRVCNLFLDTFPYNAGTTASDALWTGLPVLTLTGQSFASRVAASILNAIGLPELVTTTQEEYEATAIELAMNPEKLLAIKRKLANNRLSTPLFDTPLFTRNIETAYLTIHERYLAGLEADHIVI